MQTKKNHQTKKRANRANDLPPKTELKAKYNLLMKKSENHKNITESIPPTLREDGDPRHYTPQTKHDSQNISLKGITTGPKQIKSNSGTLEAQKPILTN